MLTIHPKIKAATLVGALAAAVVAFVQAYGPTLDPRVSGALTALAAVAAGYLKSGPAEFVPTDPVPLDGNDQAVAPEAA